MSPGAGETRGVDRDRQVGGGCVVLDRAGAASMSRPLCSTSGSASTRAGLEQQPLDLGRSSSPVASAARMPGPRRPPAGTSRRTCAGTDRALGRRARGRPRGRSAGARRRARRARRPRHAARRARRSSQGLPWAPRPIITAAAPVRSSTAWAPARLAMSPDAITGTSTRVTAAAVECRGRRTRCTSAGPSAGAA